MGVSEGGMMAAATNTGHVSGKSTADVKSPLEGKPLRQQEDVQQIIADKAYALYEQRGKREGYALQDWLDAEYLVNEQIYEAH